MHIICIYTYIYIYIYIYTHLHIARTHRPQPGSIGGISTETKGRARPTILPKWIELPVVLDAQSKLSESQCIV